MTAGAAPHTHCLSLDVLSDPRYQTTLTPFDMLNVPGAQ
jgi:hypothetical protein